MKEQIRTLLLDPWFIVGLFVRLVLVFIAAPLVQTQWFIPFLEGSLEHPSIDPWTQHLAQGGDPLAFPYGPVMYLAYLPGSALDSILQNWLPLAHIGFGVTTMLFDFGLLLLLGILLSVPLRNIVVYYWLSPIVIYICYWHGQIDIIPVTLFVLSLVVLMSRRATLAGVVMGLAVASKLSMALAAPFVLVFLWRNRRYRAGFFGYCGALLGTALIVQGPYLFSSGVLSMVFGSPEIQKIYNVAIDLGSGRKVYLVPLAYVVMLYGMWRLERMSHELLHAILGICFFLILVLTPASSGWYLWVLPFLVAFQLRAGAPGVWLGVMFSVLYVGVSVTYSSGADLGLLGIDLRQPLVIPETVGAYHLQSMLITIVSGLGLLISVRMFIHGIKRNDFFRLSRRPLAIGIAGDSGSGKDTLATALAKLFGEESVTSVAGDDYHKWDRKAPMWQAVTHLDPRANNLGGFVRDVLSLLDGKAVVSRHYDHASGTFRIGAPVKHNDVIIASGLHTLYLPHLREKLDVSIYLDMDERLRNYLKVRRDVHQRGRLLTEVERSIERRVPDADRYVRPQSEDADLVFSLGPVDPDDLARCVDLSRYKLTIAIKKGIYYEDLTRMLIGLCGMHVDFDIRSRHGYVEMIVEGEVSSEDIELAAADLLSDMGELMSPEPQWEEGMLGIMQLVSMCQVCDSLRARMV